MGEVILNGRRTGREQLRLHRDRQIRVAVDERVLPCEQQRVGRRGGVPEKRGLRDEAPVGGRDDGERKAEDGDTVGDVAEACADLAGREDRHALHKVRAEAEAPAALRDAEPVLIPSESQPVKIG